MTNRLAVSRRWMPLLTGAIAVALALTLGFAGGTLHSRLSTPGTDSVEAGFARDMSRHHAQAVDASWLAYPKATRPEVRTMAMDIATVQEYQIGVMQTWLETWHLERNTDRPAMAWMPNGTKELSPDGLMPGMATAAELEALRNATGPEVDILFCRMMLAHHLGGIHMIDGLLAKSHDSDVRALAEAMRVGQTHEVAIMQNLLTELGSSPK